jgi:hypothetical protein
MAGLDVQIDLGAVRRYDPPKTAPALLCGKRTLPVGQRELAAELSYPNWRRAPPACST